MNDMFEQGIEGWTIMTWVGVWVFSEFVETSRAKLNVFTVITWCIHRCMK